MKIHLKEAKWGDIFATRNGTLVYFHERLENGRFKAVHHCTNVETEHNNSGRIESKKLHPWDIIERSSIGPYRNILDSTDDDPVDLGDYEAGERLLLEDGSSAHYIRKINSNADYCYLLRLPGKHDVFSLFNAGGHTCDSKYRVVDNCGIDLGFVMPVRKTIEVPTNHYINLDDARIGEKWETRDGVIVTYRGNIGGHYPHVFDWPNGNDTSHKRNGRFTKFPAQGRDVIKRHVV